MATNKQNLSDLLRQEAAQDKSEPKPVQAAKDKTGIPTEATELDFSRMTKAQLLAYVTALTPQAPASVTITALDTSEITAKNQALADQVKALEKRLAEQQQAIAAAEKTIKTLQVDSSEKAKLEQELGKQQSLVEELSGQIQILETQKQTAIAKKERTVEEDRALVLARISSYQVNLQFPAQPNSSISEEDIGWFD